MKYLNNILKQCSSTEVRLNVLCSFLSCVENQNSEKPPFF